MADGQPRLPPGQVQTRKWPVLHYGSVPKTDLSTWDFKVWGEVDTPLTLTWSQFKELPPDWKFRVKVLDRDLAITPPAPDHMAWVTQDEFLNTYEGCGYDTACNYVP